jgi:tetratricopeptide (TPR) repeat protein
MNPGKLFLLMLCLLLGAASAAPAQQPAVNSDAAAADAAYTAKDWNKAASLYESLAQVDPRVPRYWYRLGVSRQALGRHEQAIQAFTKAQEAGAPAYLVQYNLACVHASMDQIDAAFRELTEALKQGFNQPDQLSSDADLAALRSDSRFAPLVEQARHNQAPCKDSPENRQFDFWLGEWSVVRTQDQSPAGDSRIELILGNCVVLENWTSAGNVGYSGKSYNTYNTSLKRWEQFWVDNVGGMIHFYGSLKDGVMDYWTDDLPQPDGSTLRRHLQFFNQGPGQVRQFSQGSKDGGKTWFVEYDLTYHRKK